MLSTYGETMKRTGFQYITIIEMDIYHNVNKSYN